jgi:hypothetical protein
MTRRIDDMKVTGEYAPVREPATLLLFALADLPILRRRRVA